MSEERRPFLRIVRGQPDDAELAAVVAVVAGLGSDPVAEKAVERRSAWGDPTRRVRGVLRPGPGAWRASGLPQ
ncbi:acyl-CoA carboxylase subunit epsilon [Umezawaea sp. NPDC059074]|uniref:acyl-CoA carboxylase subunit epsilon n=1 Tax=Umezawaea sp. NPDC059074 TaxID=3346716 RepID=UPI0036B7EC8A